jgi:hypothetical protein
LDQLDIRLSSRICHVSPLSCSFYQNLASNPSGPTQVPCDFLSQYANAQQKGNMNNLKRFMGFA